MRYIILILLSLISIDTLTAQNIAGEWKGELQIQGVALPIVFHIVQSDKDGYSATFDSPDQNAFELPCSGVSQRGDSVSLAIKMLKGAFNGVLATDNNKMTGMWSQGGLSLPLELTRSADGGATSINSNRPQTPVPPYPYNVEELVYFNKDKSIQYGATLTVPKPAPDVNYFRAPVYPVVVLITGSGQQDRDETIFGHKPFAVIADYLTRRDIAVLRIDDRGIGKTTGDIAKSTTADFTDDIEIAVDFLKTRKDIDTANIGLMGHSEGGIIAPAVASQRKDIRFIIMLAGPGIKIIDMMEQQNADVLKSAGVDSADIEAYTPLYRSLVKLIIAEKDAAKAQQKATAAFKKWEKAKSPSTIKNTTGVTDEKSMQAFTGAFVKQISQPWFRYFLSIDPAEFLSKVNCPVLALNGEKDIQVAARPNLEAIKKILSKNNNQYVTTLERKGLNHLFQHCKKCSVEEYGQIKESFDTQTLDIIAAWILTGRFEKSPQ